MNCLRPLLNCCPFLSKPSPDLDLDELPTELAENYEDFFKSKRKHKRRFEHVDKYTKSEVVLMDQKELSPNFDHIIEVIIDRLLEDILF